MRGQLGGETLPLAHQPADLLLGRLALTRDLAPAVAGGVQPGVGQQVADLGDALPERVDLPLELLHAPLQLAHLGRRLLLDDPGDGMGRCRRRRGIRGGSPRPGVRRRVTAAGAAWLAPRAPRAGGRSGGQPPPPRGGPGRPSPAPFFSTLSPEKRKAPRIVRSRVYVDSGATASISSSTVRVGFSASSWCWA